jgi:uncharacterized membrane protein (DUF106 family)
VQRQNLKKIKHVANGLVAGSLNDDKMLKKMQEMQHEFMELRKEKAGKEKEMLQMVHGIAE